MNDDKTIKEELKAFKRQSIRVAKDFSYGKDIERAIEKASSIGEINRLLRTARERKFR